MTFKMKAITAGFGLALMASASPALAKQKVCVFDILGAGGDVFNLSKDYVLAAKGFGADGKPEVRPKPVQQPEEDRKWKLAVHAEQEWKVGEAGGGGSRGQRCAVLQCAAQWQAALAVLGL